MTELDPRSIVTNRLVEDPSGVFVLEGHERFEYSEGKRVERFLDWTYRRATDLGSSSRELEAQATVWPTEYYLSVKRAQLLSGFIYDRSMKVLEVGCGCGTISRFLGETFDQVVSIEGALARARLARLRTKNLPVSVICGPFQEIQFLQKFDVIFCIGVFEYSAAFVEGPDPYEAAVAYFSEMLAPGGKLVIAIENQFGLKYFNGFNEDHLATPYEGIEGYHRRRRAVRTFGKVELENILRRQFPTVARFYPYPDYKFPDAVLSSEFLASGRADEIISQIESRDYGKPGERRWDMGAATFELSRNKMLEFFASSFLFVASRGETSGMDFPQQGIFYSSARIDHFATQSRIVKADNGALRLIKTSRYTKIAQSAGGLKHIDLDNPWLDSCSLQTDLLRAAMSRESTIEEIFGRARPWLRFLISQASEENGRLVLDGAHIDSVWQNAYQTGDEVVIIDREFILGSKIHLNALVIRTIYGFLNRLKPGQAGSPALAENNGRKLIKNIAIALGVELTPIDFQQFIVMECEFESTIFGLSRRRLETLLRWYLIDRRSLRYFQAVRSVAVSLMRRLRFKLRF